MQAAVPTLPSYHRCGELVPRCAAPLAAWFEPLKGPGDGISIVDATPLAGCDHRRIARPRVFQHNAGRGKTSRGWFYGFKLHTIITSNGELIALKLTSGSVDDRKPLPKLCKGLFGYLFADKGSIGQPLTKTLAQPDIQLITPLRKNIKPVPRTDFEKALLRRRCLIDTVFNELKNLCQIEHTGHRSVGNFLLNLRAGLLAYGLSDHKPTLKLIRIHALAAPGGLIPNSG